MYKHARTFRADPGASVIRSVRLKGEAKSNADAPVRRKLGQFRDEDTEETSAR